MAPRRAEFEATYRVVRSCFRHYGPATAGEAPTRPKHESRTCAGALGARATEGGSEGGSRPRGRGE